MNAGGRTWVSWSNACKAPAPAELPARVLDWGKGTSTGTEGVAKQKRPKSTAVKMDSQSKRSKTIWSDSSKPAV